MDRPALAMLMTAVAPRPVCPIAAPAGIPMRAAISSGSALYPRCARTCCGMLSGPCQFAAWVTQPQAQLKKLMSAPPTG